MSSPFGSIVGRVLGPAGAPVPGATVAALGTTQPSRDIAAITAADGTFRFGSVRPGTYHVEARAHGTIRAADVLVAAGTPARVEIRLGPETGVTRPLDGRVRVTNWRFYPWRCVCSLLITARNGNRRTGTGWFVAPRVVVTAGQCVYRADEGGWASQVEVIPGRNGDERPYGSAVSRELRGAARWTADADPDFDYGAILLPPERRLGDEVGWFGYAPRTDDDLRRATINLAGYPAERQGTQWFESGPVKEVRQRSIHYDLVASGQAGSPVWVMTGQGERYGVAIANREGPHGNGGTRLTAEACDDIVQWVRQAP